MSIYLFSPTTGLWGATGNQGVVFDTEPNPNVTFSSLAAAKRVAKRINRMRRNRLRKFVVEIVVT